AQSRPELDVGEDDLPNPGWAVYAPHLCQATDGPGCHRRSLGHGGRAGNDSALQPDGDDQPESRTPQPDADSGARWRPYRHPGARRRLAARLQHEGQGEDAARRLRLSVDVDGHGYLQRPDPHSVDRALDAVALTDRLALAVLVLPWTAAVHPQATRSQ